MRLLLLLHLRLALSLAAAIDASATLFENGQSIEVSACVNNHRVSPMPFPKT